METITIEFQPNVKDKLIAFLNSFTKNELHIIEGNSPNEEDQAFVAYRDRLHLAVKKFESGESKPRSLEELDEYLENIIEGNSPIEEDQSFTEYRDRLHLEVKKIESGESKLYDIDELDAMLEKVISEYEN